MGRATLCPACAIAPVIPGGGIAHGALGPGADGHRPGKVEVVAISPLLGSLVNVPLSYYLTTRLGVAGVIWGTVLTTLVSNLLIPGVYLFHLLEVRLFTFVTRTLGPPLCGALLLVPVSWICRTIVPPEPGGTASCPGRLPFWSISS